MDTNKTAGKVAYSYLRFSSPEQAKGDSIRRQMALSEDWAKRHGFTLDPSLTLRDEGTSAYKGEHQQNPDRHALASFLELVKQGRVPRGAYLIIENLDRLTRQDAVPATNLFTGLLMSGIHLVQLNPEQIYHDDCDFFEVMRAVMELSRGNSESKQKSIRLKAVWSEKRKDACKSKKVISRSCPAWLHVVGDRREARYMLIPERAAVVRQIFNLAIDGLGVRLIAQKLTTDNVPPFGKKPWTISYLKMVLNNRATFGEFTPRSGRGSPAKRKVAGEPVPDYYPAAINQEIFFAAQNAMLARRQRGGRPSKAVINLFASLLFDARSGGRIHVKQYKLSDGRLHYCLAPNAGVVSDAAFVSFPFDAFEQAILRLLREIDPKEILPRSGDKVDAVQALLGRQASIMGRIEKVQNQMENGDGDVGPIMASLRKLNADLEKVKADLEAAKRLAATPLSGAWNECHNLLDALEQAEDLEAAKLRLRGLLRRIVESIWCLFMPGHGNRKSGVQINFKGGLCRRFVILLERSTTGPAPRSEELTMGTFAKNLPSGNWDFREKGNIRKIEAALNKLKQ